MPNERRPSLNRMVQLERRPPHVRSVNKLSFSILVWALLGSAVSVAPTDIHAQTNPLPDEQIVQKIDAAVFARSNSIATYSVKEQYSLFRNGDTEASAEELVQTSYTQAEGKEYTPISQSGSAMLRSAIIDKILAGEKEMNQPANRESTWITSANYEMHPEPASAEISGHVCVVVDLKSKRKSPHLFNGQAWFDATDYTIVRLKGTPSQSPSVLAGEATVTRDYEKVDGFAMATHAEARSHSFLLGDTLLKIDYTGYEITRRPTSETAHQTPAP